MSKILVKIWRLLRGRIQWYILWLFHAKFIIGILGVIFNCDGEVLLLRHRYWPEGSWGLPSGYTNRGEILPDTLKREVLEETGYNVKILGLLRVVSGYKLRLEISYTGIIENGTEKVDPGEIIELKFFAPKDLPGGLLKSHQELVALACEQRKNNSYIELIS